MDVDDSLLSSLIEREIPDGRKALLDSHRDLFDLAGYCKENYANSIDKKKALEEAKTYASQSLASVAYQIHSLAVNMMQMFDQQAIQLQKMKSDANHISLVVDIHKEKIARREIGVLTSSKNFSRSHKIVAPAQQEKPKKYKRVDVDYSVYDDIGHGVRFGRSSDEQPLQRRNSNSSSSGSVKGVPISASSVRSSSQTSLVSQRKERSGSDIYQSVSGTPPSERPPQQYSAPINTKAPAAPYKPAFLTPSASSMPPRPPIAPVSPKKSFDKTASLSAMPPPPAFMSEPGRDYDDDRFAQGLPPPPPDLESAYQIPSNNARAEDLPPPPPDSFLEDVTLPPPPALGAGSWKPVNEAPDSYIEKVIAQYDYDKQRDDELQLFEGDVLYVVKKNDDGWYEGVKNGFQGLFPGNYVTPYM